MVLVASAVACAGGEYEEAKMSAGDRARNLAVSHEVEALIQRKEGEVAVKRRQGIVLLETYLREHGPTPETPEVVFQLAELKWEEAKSQFLQQMSAFNTAVENCAKEKQARCKTPPQPTLELVSSQALYKRLLTEYPSFRKTDAVLYLYGFSLRSEGKLDQALVQFKRILNEHAQSRFRPDAWMAVAESRFYDDSDYKGALAGYDEVLKYPDSPLYDLALFKTAWCYWKLGDSDRAARRFKEVLDLGSGVNTKSLARAHQLTEGGRKRLEELKGEALDYLVQVFTEDERKGPKDAFDFLSSIGGAGYSRKVIAKLAETFFTQARYDRAIESERFLMKLDPNDEGNPDRHKRVVEALREMDQNKDAVKELRKLAETYGPGSEWAKAQQNPQAVEHAHKVAATMLREVAKALHADAQRNEQQQKGHIDQERYARAAEAYSFYLQKFPADADALEVHYLLGDIYFFKLKKYDESGDQYLAVGKSKPVGKLHREALLQSIASYEKLRRDHSGGGKKELLPSDKRMGEAIDLYATLFPQDPEIAGVLFKNGQLFYDYGEYDEAVKRFGLIVEKYPKNQVAGAAGDKILESLNKAHDYENVESWARRLLKVPAFQAKDDQARLQKLVIDAGMKAGEQKAESDPMAAADIYQRVANEFPTSPRATAALVNAATLYVKAGKPEEAVKLDAVLVDKYPSSTEAPQAAWAAGKLYEQAALWDQAARFYQTLADRYPKDKNAADALFNAGLLKEHLGDTQAAIAAYSQYAQRYKTRDDVKQVAFRVGVVYAEAGQHEAAGRAFGDYALKYPGNAQTIEAFSRQGAELIASGQDKRAQGPLKEAVALYRRGADRAAAPAAAHARYLEGEVIFREFERVKLASDPKKLKRTLDEKSKLMEQAKQAYVDVVTFNDPEWATAALYRIGEAYERFAKALRDAPVPKELNADEQQVYRDELEKVVVVVEEKAIDAYKNGYQKALQLAVYNEFTQKLRGALGRMSDQEFPAENEARARPAAAEPRMNLPFVSAVQR
ncbi:MAG: Tetratricopeptide 2 repeat protein [Myxococcales bacterium]|nr:Tetratricopeptide 2 repeat protein [Myxococcales bacterium]